MTWWQWFLIAWFGWLAIAIPVGVAVGIWVDRNEKHYEISEDEEVEAPGPWADEIQAPH